MNKGTKGNVFEETRLKCSCHCAYCLPW